jgi:cardiolipin synthase
MRNIWNTFKKFRKIFGSRVLILFLSLILQLIVIVYFTNYITGLSVTFTNVINFIIRVLAILIIILILNKHNNPTFNIMWCIIICTIPIVGVMLYLFMGNRQVASSLQRKQLKQIIDNKKVLKQDEKLEDLFDNENVKLQYNYLKTVYFPYYKNTNSKYFSSGEAFFPSFLEDLKNAKHFIFIEFFIITDGKVWSQTYQLLKQKAKEGVKVFLIYDDVGCVESLGKAFNKKALEDNIYAVTFNPLRPRLIITMNNRDHRKLVIVDNKIGYTGGCNLADEYINEKELFGYWKYSMIRIEGDAVWNMTVMFIQFYNAITKTGKLDYFDYKLSNNIKNESLVLPFSDSPSDNEDAARTVHLNMINKARKYIYITTPYLVTDYDMEVALTSAAKQGVDVRIITPHIPDKSYVFAITRSNYEFLVKGGVKIYEFTPGFIHAKDFISDDQIALVGTINMDYRSYYMHFEDGILINDRETIKDMKDEYFKTLSVSHQMTLDELDNQSAISKIIRAVLNVFALMM